MDSSRDSSVWRSLAVTFGGGLALGAVGMKLTQTALRPVELTPRPDPNPQPDRLSLVERRLERMEQTPVATRPPGTVPTPAIPIDQKVLEAVIGAVDARLHEHAGQVERRLADLEARLAIEAQTLHRQDRQTAEAGEKNAAEIQRQYHQEAEALRAALNHDLRQFSERLSEAVVGQTAIHTEVQALHQQNERLVDAAEQRFADMRYEYRQAVAELREGVSQALSGEKAARDRQFQELKNSLEQSLEARIITAAAAATAAQYDDRLAPLRAEVRQKEQELAELRQRLAESEHSVLDVVSAIGQVCREAAERMNRRSEPPSSAPPVAPEASQPATPGTEPLTLATAAPVQSTPATVVTLPAPELAADPSLSRSIPDFLHESDRMGTWRIPLVSSLLVTVTTGCLLLLHYL